MAALHPEFTVQTLTPHTHPGLALWSTAEPPRELHVQGHPDAFDLLDELPTNGLAVVGTREPQPRSIQLLKKWIQDLRGTPLILLSGLARGIDATAHEAALNNGLRTIAILGGGLDIPYPRENLALRERILINGGLLITEYPEGCSPQAHHFLRRNRLIAGWSRATWVVEASFQSGALNTARWARDQHLDVFAVPCFPGDPALAGNQKLIDDGHAHCFWGAHSLGRVWIDFSNLPVSSGSPHIHRRTKAAHLRSVGEPASDEHLIAEQVSSEMSTQAAATVQELLDWAFARSWTAQRFFDALERALKDQLIVDKNGLLLKNPEISR